MRLEEPKYGGKLRLVVSRRNVLSLLAKLDGYPPGSRCTLGGGSDADGIELAIEEDDVHYKDRPAGRMIGETELRTTKPTSGTEWGNYAVRD